MMEDTCELSRKAFAVFGPKNQICWFCCLARVTKFIAWGSYQKVPKVR